MGARLTEMREAMQHEAHLRHTIADLKARDDYLLDDIGVRRADIVALVRGRKLDD
jgi:uncharacterized protein YjiS (DUF1127 family)